MLKHILFARYALRFERAYKNDQWAPVARCFHEQARYTMKGAAPFEGEVVGRDEIARLFPCMLDNFDRRFDRRVPKMITFPRVTDGVLGFRWRVHYFLGAERFVLNGETACEFRGGKIWRLRDYMDEEDCARGEVLLPRLGGRSPPWT